MKGSQEDKRWRFPNKIHLPPNRSNNVQILWQPFPQSVQERCWPWSPDLHQGAVQKGKTCFWFTSDPMRPAYIVNTNTQILLISWLFDYFDFPLHIANTVDLVQLSTTDVSNGRGISLPFVSFHLKYKFGCLHLNSIWIISFTICSLFLYIGVTLSCCYETVYWNTLIQFSPEFAFASVVVAVVSRLGSAWDKEGI